MKTNKLLLGVVGALILVGSARDVRAEGTTCAAPTSVVPDGRLTQSSIGAGQTFFFTFAAPASRSFTFEARNTAGVFDQDPAGTFAAFSDPGVCGAPLTTVATEGVDPQMHASSGVRRSFTTANANGATFSITNNTGGAIAYQFSVSETTMFSPAWTTNGTYNTYYSFYNTTNTVITGVVSLTTTAGASAGSTTIVIQPGRTSPTNTVALATPRNTTGTAAFTHNGPPGAILAEGDIANFTSTPGYIQPIKFEAVRDKR